MSNGGGRAWAWSLLLVIGALAGCLGDEPEEHDHSDHDHGLEEEGQPEGPALVPTLGFDVGFANGTGNVTFFADVLLCLAPETHDASSEGNATEDANTTENANTTADDNTTADGNGTADGNATAEGNGTADGNATTPDAGQTATFDGERFTCPEGLAPEGDEEATNGDEDAQDEAMESGNATAQGNTTSDEGMETNTTADGNATGEHPAGPFDYVLDLGDGTEMAGTDADFPLVLDHTYGNGTFTAILEITFLDADPLVGGLTIDLSAPDVPEVPAGDPPQLVFEFGPTELGCVSDANNMCIGVVLAMASGVHEDGIDGWWIPLDDRYAGMSFTTDSDNSDTDCAIFDEGMSELADGNNGGGPCQGAVPAGAAWMYVNPWATPASYAIITFA